MTTTTMTTTMTTSAHPYREPIGRLRADAIGDSLHEERVLVVALIALGGVRVVCAAASGLPFDGESTVALFMLASGVLWLSQRLRRHARRRRRHRHARRRRRHRRRTPRGKSAPRSRGEILPLP